MEGFPSLLTMQEDQNVFLRKGLAIQQEQVLREYSPAALDAKGVGAAEAVEGPGRFSPTNSSRKRQICQQEEWENPCPKDRSPPMKKHCHSSETDHPDLGVCRDPSLTFKPHEPIRRIRISGDEEHGSPSIFGKVESTPPSFQELLGSEIQLFLPCKASILTSEKDLKRPLKPLQSLHPSVPNPLGRFHGMLRTAPCNLRMGEPLQRADASLSRKFLERASEHRSRGGIVQKKIGLGIATQRSDNSREICPTRLFHYNGGERCPQEIRRESIHRRASA